MRAPPAVSVQAPARWPWRATQSFLSAAAAAAGGAWLARHLETGLVGSAAVLAVTLGVAGVAWRRSSRPVASLAWTGSRWLVSLADEPAIETGPPRVMLDLGAWMLLAIRPVTGRQTLWVDLSQGDAGASWQAFRAAVYSFASDSLPRSPSERPPP